MNDQSSLNNNILHITKTPSPLSFQGKEATSQLNQSFPCQIHGRIPANTTKCVHHLLASVH